MERRRPAALEVGGFRVGFDWTVLVGLALVARSLATQILPFGWPGYSLGTFWFAGLAGAGLFLGSLAAHELSHAIAARRAAGVEVEDTTFWLFGGVSRPARSSPPRGCTCWSPGSGRSPACCSVRHSGCSACLWPRPVSAGWLWARCAGRR